MWVFGYGSLMWKADFPYVERVVGFITGFQRRFYQLSTDHRGTPRKPGRVVTLLPSTKADRVYGVAYRISPDDEDVVIRQLDHREKGGYVRVPTRFYPRNLKRETFVIIIYIAKKDNPQYAGPASLDDIAKQVVASSGPSGSNVDYVVNLAKAMRELAPDVEDEHLYVLERKVENLLKLTSSESFTRDHSM